MGPKAHDRYPYRERPMIERSINQLKRYRQGATRYEKLAATQLVMVTFASTLDEIQPRRQLLHPRN